MLVVKYLNVKIAIKHSKKEHERNQLRIRS